MEVECALCFAKTLLLTRWKGLRFTNTGKTAVLLNGSNNIRVTRNTFALPAIGGDLIWLQVSGVNSHHNRIDRNDFGNKTDTAPLIAYQGDGNGNISQFDVIEYNYFHDVGPWVSNGKETIRLGLSSVSLSSGFNTIQYNLFENYRRRTGDRIGQKRQQYGPL